MRAIEGKKIAIVGGGPGGLTLARLLQQSGATHYIEVGPGKVLSGLNRQIDRALATTNVEDTASLEKTLAAFA